MKRKTVYTTGEVARLCHVTAHTVTKWFDSGMLRGYRLPGSQDRRIPRDQLIRFLKAHEMPLGDLEEDGRRRVLVVGGGLGTVSRLREYLPDDTYDFELAGSGFEAGIQAESFRPDVAVIDFAMGRSEALQVARRLKVSRFAGRDPLVLIGLASEDEQEAQAMREVLFDAVFVRPFDVELLVASIKE